LTFTVRFATSSYAPPRSVTILTPNNNWRNIDAAYVNGGWEFALDETELFAEPSYFKFVLDDRYWMDDPYIRIAPVEGDLYLFDEERVSFDMSTTAPTIITTPPTPPPQPPAPPQAITLPVISEGAVINRVVLIATPFITAAAAWVAGLIARHVPGVKLDQTQVVSFMIAIVVVCLAGAWKWLQGWQQDELLVAQRLAAPLKAVIASVPTVTTVTTVPAMPVGVPAPTPPQV
jgi:hypothetical protein